jgi:hypothetical protein
MKKCLIACLILILLFSTSIVSAENVLSKSSVNSQSSRQILTRKDIPLLSNTIALSKDTETREILTEIRNKVSISGSITEQEIRELVEGFGWRPFFGFFHIYADTTVLFLPGFSIYNLLGYYLGPFVICIWISGELYGLIRDRGYTSGILFSGLGYAIRDGPWRSPRIFCDFYGVCTLGFFKPD